jgi:hypothetical protein
LVFVDFAKLFEDVAFALFFLSKLLGSVLNFQQLFGIFLIDHEAGFKVGLERSISGKEASETMVTKLSSC